MACTGIVTRGASLAGSLAYGDIELWQNPLASGNARAAGDEAPPRCGEGRGSFCLPPAALRCKVYPPRSLCELFLAGIGTGEQLVHTNHLAVQCSRDERFAFDYAPFGVGNGDVIDLQSFAYRALIIGSGLDEIG